MHHFELPKRTGGRRAIDAPAVRDRIVERALLEALTPALEPHLGPCSYGYRRGIGVEEAIEATCTLRDTGRRWVVRSDLHDFFPSIARWRLIRKVEALVVDERVRGLLRILVERPYGSGVPRERRPTGRGIPQGSPLSPLLANLLLAEFDRGVAAHGFPIVRYADDFVIGATSEAEAWEAMRCASGEAEELELTLSPSKSQITSFDEGFAFLGQDFGPVYPPTTGAREVSPDRKVLYVGMQGAHLAKRRGRLTVRTRVDQEVLSVPAEEVARIVLLGPVGLSAGVRAWALASGIDCVMLSRRGSYLGLLTSAATHVRVERLRAQLEVSDSPDRSLDLARVIVSSKIRQQSNVLLAAGWRGADGTAGQTQRRMELLERSAMSAATKGELLGLEGAAARDYFAAFGALLPEPLRFSKRSRRPPEDIVNSALGYAYALLLTEAVSAIVSVGLEPSIGVLHEAQRRRPALALDLMEEFRPLAVDRAILELSMSGELKPDFRQQIDEGRGVHLSRRGKELVVDCYERQMLSASTGMAQGHNGNLRQALYRQAENLAGALVGGSVLPAVSWRP